LREIIKNLRSIEVEDEVDRVRREKKERSRKRKEDIKRQKEQQFKLLIKLRRDQKEQDKLQNDYKELVDSCNKELSSFYTNFADVLPIDSDL
jgi:hypothetical protein